MNILEYALSAAILVHVAFLFHAMGFLARDELVLRLLVVTGTCFYILYYISIADIPLWDAIITSSILGVINLYMIVVLVVERTMFAMDDRATRSFKYFSTLNPGEYRKINKLADRHIASTQTTLTQENNANTRLIFILEGEVLVEKHGQSTTVNGPVFIGEVGMVLDSISTATTTIAKGVEYETWDYTELRKLMAGSTAIKNALIALFSKDMAHKVGASMPTHNSH